MKSIIAISIFMLTMTSVYSFNARKCAQNVWLKMGWWREYDVKYTSIELISSRTSTQEGTTKTSSEGSTQDTTMVSDPGVTTGQMLSTSQFTSSFGECALWAANINWMKREKYIAQNYRYLKLNSARGEGEYADSLLHLSQCNSGTKPVFHRLLKRNYNDLFENQKKAWSISSKIDRLIRKNPTLLKSCVPFQPS